MSVVIFDADGTLTPQRDTALGAWEACMLPGVAERCAQLRAAGVVFAIASNQSARRLRADIIAQLQWTQRAIGAVTIRWATTEARRKPRPVMLTEIMAAVNAMPTEAVFVGDQETDRQAAEAAGIEFVWARDFFRGEER